MIRQTSDQALLRAVAELAPAHTSPEDDGLALVAREGDFDDRYRVWRGRSGRKYLVTVMPLSDAMRAENAVVLLVALDDEGGRRILWAGESGQPTPGLELSPGVALEAHAHLLARTACRRRTAIDDLVNGAQSYSSVLTVSAAASHAKVGSTTPRRSSSRAVFTT
ncbi:hypothetical protein [Hansschlegelia zhihuaiae]|uniref:Uncharacterized protein n=1 Tax=Hansschlegelia zhihuaiae TaxID=405005 RepID=A0A4Q0MBZ8_9HYPH|nr:hypothetical protein [Hansschlegelia zhihuaiae]RXF70850.1 hypothetical protein EK403_16910 [Hansschlegelia zhihuaiae]